jgi:hypothetical protein
MDISYESTFLTWILFGDEWSASVFGRFITRERSRGIHRRLFGPPVRAGGHRERNIFETSWTGIPAWRNWKKENCAKYLIIRGSLRVSHRRPARKDIPSGSFISLYHSYNFVLLKYFGFFY